MLLDVCCLWLFVERCWLFVVRCLMVFVVFGLFVFFLLVVDCWLLRFGFVCPFAAVGCRSFGVCCL